MPDFLIQGENALSSLLVIVLLTIAFAWSSYGCRAMTARTAEKSLSISGGRGQANSAMAAARYARLLSRKI